MIHLSVRYKGRTISMEVPDSADVKIDLTDTDSYQDAPGRVALLEIGPSARRLYSWLLTVARGREVVDVDPVIAEAEVGMVPISLGKTLSSLEKHGLVSIVRRKKSGGNRVLAYRLKILDKNQEVYIPGGTPSPWEDAVGDIEASLGVASRVLYEALFRMADIDGNVIGSTRRDVCFAMRPVPDRFPADSLSGLEDALFLTVNQNDPLSVSISGFAALAKAVQGD